MSVQITIIGLGQVGSSIGLALAEQKSIKRVGHDKDYDVGRLAQKNGAIDEFKMNLPASVSEANVVILSLPLTEIQSTLKYIAQDLQEGTVVIDTAPSKGTVTKWFEEVMPQGWYYVGLTPAVGVDYLYGNDLGIQSARADLFKKGVFLVNAPHGTPGEAVKLATDLVGLLGATALISDSMEADGLVSSAHLLPQLVSAALLDATITQPGWNDARKIAARPFAAAASASIYYDEAKSLAVAALGNHENVIPVLDAYMESLQRLRNSIEDGDEKAVTEYFERNAKAYDKWLTERAKADWQTVETADVGESFGERLSHMFMGNIMDRVKKRK